MIEDLKPLLKRFIIFAKDNLNFKRPPRLFLKQDTANQKCMLGKTAHYDPANQAVTLYISGRHPKDILRSFAHELVHHCQNERGDLHPDKMKTMNQNYAQENDHMRKMEKEAYLQGNMCFRDWEDGLDDKLQYKMKLAEQKFLKENKTMSVKISKKELKNLIQKLLENKLGEQREMIQVRDLSDGGELDKAEATMEKAKQLFGSMEAAQAAAKKHGSIAAAIKAKEEETNSAVAAGGSLEEEQLEEGCGGGAHGKRACGMRDCPSCIKNEMVQEEENKCPECAENKDGEKCEKCKKKSEENRELQEKKSKKKGPKPDYLDLDGDGNRKESMKKAAADKKKKKKKANESKIQTPEQENTLYESRFTQRNTRLFEKLLKEWTK